MGNQDTNTLTYIVTSEDEDKTLKDILYKRIKLSGRLLRKAKNDNSIYVNDLVISLGSKLRKGDIVKVKMKDEENQFEPEDIPIEVSYEDLDLLIINKQPGFVVHPTKGHSKHTIANGIANYQNITNQRFKIRFINRLDMDTSGLLMIAKNPFAQQAISQQMEKNIVEKFYLAIVKGVIKEDEGTINVPIGLTNKDRVRRQVTEDGQESITHYNVLERYDSATLIRLKLLTGRTHQIRVHMKHIGYPLIGDELYGFVNKEFINRQALHAETLKFRQPRTGEEISVKAELPSDMLQLIERLKYEK